MADSGFFSRLSRPILFINTCRGETVVESDLLAARDAGKVSAMILDVFSGEPRVDPAVAAAAKVITPHIAGYSVEGKVGGAFQVAEAFRGFFSLSLPELPPWPSPARPEIAYPSDKLPDGDFLSLCIRRAYDIQSDDARLRQALIDPFPEPAFDRLRKDYPVRHEFKAYSVTGIPPEKTALRSQLAKLGFRLL